MRGDIEMKNHLSAVFVIRNIPIYRLKRTTRDLIQVNNLTPVHFVERNLHIAPVWGDIRGDIKMMKLLQT